MEITIGVQHHPRELTVESDQPADQIVAAVQAALDGRTTTLDLTDVRGRRVVVPSAVLGYVEIGAETKGRVGFGQA